MGDWKTVRSVWHATAVALAVFCAVPTPVIARDASPTCKPVVAHIVSVQGTVELLRAREKTWAVVQRIGIPVCQGDLLHTGRKSRAALVIPPEKLMRLDQNSTLSITLNATSEGEVTQVEFFQDERTPKEVLGNSCGSGYFITRFPRRFKVLTPYVNAAIDGTEFQVTDKCSAGELAVFEGKVTAESVFGAKTFQVQSGQVLSTGPGEPPAIKVLVKPVDAVQWALYYPPLSAPTFDGEIDDACDRAADKRGCITRRAEQHLRVGRVDDAQADIDALLSLDAGDSDAYALASVISVAKNDKASALLRAQQATERDPNNARAWIALSYAQQAHFKLEDALASAEKAVELNARSSTAQARVAELLMSLGRTRSAERAAQAAVDSNPAESRAHTILGFVHLTQIDTKKARSDFEAAIERDSSDPLPRLGLGLAMIRQGDLVGGREQIEIAVILDPSNSLIRSYVGKAYYEENTSKRDELAATQFGIARQLDPKDPTPWFYDAILKQTQNRPVEALQDLQKSIELNDNRAVYRSRLLLDQDRAARSANLAQVYQDAGFDQLALAEAYKSLATDPDNYASHRFLAEAYEASPRQDAARQSEYLQSLLREPIGILPVSPFRSAASPSSNFPRPALAASLSPFRASFNSYESLFERAGIRLFADGLVATQDTWSSQLVVAGAGDSVAFSVGHGVFRSDGFDKDRSANQDGTNLFVQLRATDNLYVQAEFIESRFDRGVIDFDFDPLLRQVSTIDERSTEMRIGGRYEINPESTVYLSGASQMFTRLTQTGATGRASGDANTGEAQYSFSGPNVGLLAGVGYLEGSVGPSGRDNVSYDSQYVYGRISDARQVMGIHVGVSQLEQKNLGTRLLETNPKLGGFVIPFPGTTLRVALLKYTRRPLIGNETLEPTQFVGFNQVWDEPNGTSVWQMGAGWDQRLGHSTFVGLEVLDRDIKIPSLSAAPPALQQVTYIPMHESSARAYLYQVVPGAALSTLLRSWTIALSAEYFYQDLDREHGATLDGIVKLRTLIVPLAVTLFPGSRWSVRVGATYVRRDGLLEVFPFPGFLQVDPKAELWTGEAVVNFQFPNRRGRLSFGVTNAFDERFRILDSNFTTLVVPPKQVLFGRLSLTF